MKINHVPPFYHLTVRTFVTNLEVEGGKIRVSSSHRSLNAANKRIKLKRNHLHI